jgi:2-succinyl-5-enolpyruvyl-6-hydroxy-3-cyclohexene-1-carboxylate synthase
MLLLTADRPPELIDTGANQTADQEKLYGDAVRWYRDLPEPAADDRRVRALRTTAARALSASLGPPAGPVHLNCRFRKPLEPVAVPGDVPADFATDHPEAADGRGDSYVETRRGRPRLDAATLDGVAAAVRDAERGLLVCGPADEPTPSREALSALVDATGFPVLADPLSGARFGSHAPDRPILGGYDAYLDERVTRSWPSPEVVLRFGASPTSKALRRYLARTGARQYLVDPAPAGWREAEFRATDRLVADPDATAAALADRVDRAPDQEWRARFDRAERTHWTLARDAPAGMEGSLLRRVVADAPDPATLFVSNSMPVRDLDRFGAPRDADLRALGNRGLSGIDGVTSTALGAGSAVGDPLVLVTGDLAYYHDMNGLLALGRCDVDATVVLVNNDGGGIFHMLPIESFDPPFTEQFKTPHGLDFAPTGDLYGFEYVRTPPEDFGDVYRAALADGGTRVVEVRTDAAASHRERERLRERLVDRLAE